MRKIDADNLIEEIESLRISIVGMRSEKDQLSKCLEEYKKSVLRIIDEQPTVDEWTPVEEGLPTNDDDVLVSTVNDDVKIAWYDHMWDSEKGSYDDEEIMAWQPSPKPYKKKGE